MSSGRIPHCTRNFNPRPPRGGRHLTDEYERKEEKFQSTPPARGATKERGVYVIGAIFQSTPPARGATGLGKYCLRGHNAFQSTPPARGATLRAALYPRVSTISIHAPREGGDAGEIKNTEERYHISIHAPREGGDVGGKGQRLLQPVFQSTPPARGATLQGRKVPDEDGNFNPRPPRGGRRGSMLSSRVWSMYFNPRPPRGGRRMR